MIITDTNSLAALIRKTRKEQNLTQTQLAAVCGVGLRFIVDLEKGKETCQLGKALKVILLLGIELDAK